MTTTTQGKKMQNSNNTQKSAKSKNNNKILNNTRKKKKQTNQHYAKQQNKQQVRGIRWQNKKKKNQAQTTRHNHGERNGVISQTPWKSSGRPEEAPCNRIGKKTDPRKKNKTTTKKQHNKRVASRFRKANTELERPVLTHHTIRSGTKAVEDEEKCPCTGET